MDNQNQIILYQDDNDITRVSVRFADEDLWLTQNQLAEIYCTTQENISMHIRNIYADNELDANRTYKDFLLVHLGTIFGTRKLFSKKHTHAEMVIIQLLPHAICAISLYHCECLNNQFHRLAINRR